jgi:hypothetical protein
VKRLKRLAGALGKHDDYIYDRSWYGRGGKAGRRNQRAMKALITRKQRRKDNTLNEELEC